MQTAINGILLLDKPINLTSNNALQKIKRLFNAKKAGHTGSLDPLATGMLPICFGEATKFSQFLLASDKSYRVVAKLGVQTETGDAYGEVIATNKVIGLNALRIEEMMMQKFLGEMDQIPPMYSAIKFEGRPLYEYARKGIEVLRKPRRITISSLQLEAFDQDQFTFCVKCSKGTYIRTLVEEMGRELGCGGHVIGLRRLTVYPYDAARMHTLSDLEDVVKVTGKEKLLDFLLPIESAVICFLAVKLSSSTAFYLRNGQPVRVSLAENISSVGDVSVDDISLVRLMLEDGTFLGMGEIMPDGRVKPIRLVAA